MPYREDFHIHTMFSGDSESNPEKSLETALSKDLDKIIFTDHCECDNKKSFPPGIEPWADFDYDGYALYMTDFMKRHESSPVKIGMGLELGSAMHDKPYAEKVIASHEWDYIIGSNHIVRGEFDFYYLDYKKIDHEKIFRQYFEELYEMTEYDRFDVLGHLYYFVRYAFIQGVEVDLKKYEGYMVDIFKQLAANGKGIEVNTSDIYREYKKTIPGIEHLKLYKQCGGEIVTIGSDSHTPDTVGRGQDEAISLIKEAGFRAIASYEKRKPVFMDI